MEQYNLNERSGTTSYILTDFEDRDFDVDDDPYDFGPRVASNTHNAGVSASIIKFSFRILGIGKA